MKKFYLKERFDLNAEIICVGTELLLGEVLNTNVTFISKRLAEIGVNVYNQYIVGDNSKRLTELLEQTISYCDLIILTGGLGPTCDDITKEVVSKFLGLKLNMDSEILNQIIDVFRLKGAKMTDNNKKQALVPEGSIVIKNPNGTAPGLIIEKSMNNPDSGKNLSKLKKIILLPGPPKEMEWMFENQVMPYLQKQSRNVIVSKNVNIFGVCESFVEETLHDLMKNLKNPTVAPYSNSDEVLVRVTCMSNSREESLEKIEPVIAEIKKRLGENFIYGIDATSIQDVVVSKLVKRGLKVSTAESCTGGLISKRITDISGSSNVFELGMCAYANRIKEKVLGVKSQTLSAFGAVSKETAIEMAKGVRKLSGADIGISSTGIAGPSGGTKEKPVGLVYIALDSIDYTEFCELRLGTNFLCERDSIRYNASSHALMLLLKYLNKI